jgi:hypothetical protein
MCFAFIGLDNKLYIMQGTNAKIPKQNDALELHAFLPEFTGIEICRLNL